jgi:hypothetical protein
VSKSAEQIYALLVEANPYPDVHDLPESAAGRTGLRVVDSPEEAAADEAPPTFEPPKSGKRRRFWIPALAGGLALAVAFTGAVIIGRALIRDTRPATGDPTVYAPTIADLEALARNTIADWNRGDLEVFLLNFAPGANYQDGAGTRPIADPDMILDLGFFMSLGQQVVFDECEGTLEPPVLRCSATKTDDLSGPDGFSKDYFWEMHFGPEGITLLFLDIPEPDGPTSLTVISDLALWIMENHPDVFDRSFSPLSGLCKAQDANFYTFWCSSPQAAEEMLLLWDDFYAQAGY